jgi:LacI family transcriptional regulator
MTTITDPKKRATIKDVARVSGTSSATVSMALRKDPRISEETRRRVETAAVEVGYVYNRSAANLRNQSSDIIGLVIGDIANPFFAQLSAGVNEVLTDAGKMLFLASYNEDPERQASLLSRLSEQSVDGILLCPAFGTDPAMVNTLQQWQIPCVQLLRTLPDSPFDYVSTDYRRGIDQICEHLIALGHRQIAFVGGDRLHSATLERHQGFIDALQRHELDASLIFHIEPSRHSGRNFIETLRREHPEVSAAVCFNDVTAFGMMAGLRRLGLVPGRDFAITGFDNVEEAEDRIPALTTVDSHAFEMGRRAAHMLLARMEFPDQPRQQHILPAELIIRGSCGNSGALPSPELSGDRL